MECATGLTDDEFDGLLARLREEGVEGCPPILGLSGSLRAAVMYMRHNSIVRAAICRTPAVLLLTAEEMPRDCGHRGGRRHSISPAGTGATAAICGRSSTGARG